MRSAALLSNRHQRTASDWSAEADGVPETGKHALTGTGRHALAARSARAHAQWLRCVDGRDHVVAADAMADALVTGTGWYPASCGAPVAPVSLLEPPAPRCPRCVLAWLVGR